MEGAPPYGPFTEMLEYIKRMAPRESLRYSLGDDAPEVARLMPELRNIYPDIPPAIQLPPEQQRWFLFNAFRSFVERAASVTPLVIVFEDLHWADEPTLLLLQHHAQTLTSASLLVICTYRDMELEVARPFARTLERLLREKQATRISLKRLPPGGVTEMLAAMSGQTPPPSLGQIIFDQTEGNPFFVEEVFRHLSEEGKLFDHKGKWLSDLNVERLKVPEGVRLVVGRRLDRLGEDARRILTIAAVIGRSFSLRLLEELESRNPEAVLDAVEEAERAHLVIPESEVRDARYRFVHELIRQTLAESLSLPRRQRLHLRIADGIERVYAGRLEAQVSQVAYHLYRAGAVADPEATTTYLLMAARQARAGSAHEEALENLDRALSLWEEHGNLRSAELLEQRASTLRSLGCPDEAVASYRKAIDLFEANGALAKVAEASIELSYLQAWRLDSDSANRTMERAHRLVKGHDGHLLGDVLSMRAAIMSAIGEPEIAERMFEEAKALGTSTPVPSQEPPDMLDAIHYYQSFQLGKVRSACPAVAATCRECGDAWNASSVEFYGLWAEMYCGRPEAGAAALPPAMLRAEKIGHHGAIWALKIGASIVSAGPGRSRGLEPRNRRRLGVWGRPSPGLELRHQHSARPLCPVGRRPGGCRALVLRRTHKRGQIVPVRAVGSVPVRRLRRNRRPARSQSVEKPRLEAARSRRAEFSGRVDGARALGDRTGPPGLGRGSCRPAPAHRRVAPYRCVDLLAALSFPNDCRDRLRVRPRLGSRREPSPGRDPPDRHRPVPPPPTGRPRMVRPDAP